MNQALLDKIESEQFRKQPARFNVGDSVRVHTKVVEGDKERIQVFAGVVIGMRGRGLSCQKARSVAGVGPSPWRGGRFLPGTKPGQPGLFSSLIVCRALLSRARLNCLSGLAGVKE